MGISPLPCRKVLLRPCFVCQPLRPPTSIFYHAHAEESLSAIMRRLRPLDFRQRDRAKTFHESRMSFFTRKANDHEGTLLSREQGLAINPCRNKAHLPGFLLPAARF